MKTTQYFLVFLKRHALKVTTVVSLDLLYFFHNLKRTNEKNQSYHIATCMHQLVILICKSQLVTYQNYKYSHYIYSHNLHISCFSLLKATKFNQYWRMDCFPSLSLVPFNLYDNLSETTKQEESKAWLFLPKIVNLKITSNL